MTNEPSFRILRKITLFSLFKLYTTLSDEILNICISELVNPIAIKFDDISATDVYSFISLAFFIEIILLF